MLTVVITALMPVFVGLGIGYFAGYKKIVDNWNISSLNVLLMQFLLPITLFISIARTPGSVIRDNAALAIVIALALVVVYLPFLFVERRIFKLAPGDAAVQTLTSAFPNFASIGLPLLTPFFKGEAGLPVAIAIAIGSVTISPLTIALLEMAKASQTPDKAPGAPISVTRAFGHALINSVKKPIFIGPILGLIVSLVGIHLPSIFAVAFSPLTSATAGVGLFLTGLMLSAQPIKVDANVVFSVAVKNVVQPAFGVGLAYLFRLPINALVEVALLLTIPAGFFGLVFGASVGNRPAVSGSTLVLSSIVSIATLATAILIFTPMIGK